jgi:hypothetical protein
MARNPRREILRLPVHRGLFYFGPSYLNSEEEWASNFSTLIESLLCEAKYHWSIIDKSGWQITIRFKLTDFMVDARNGTFTIYEHSDDDDAWVTSWYGPISDPEQFFDDLSNAVFPDHLNSEINSALAFSGDLMRQMLARRRAAIEKGYASFEARIGSISNNFCLLALDQVRRLTLVPPERDFEMYREDTKLDDAKGPNQEMFYSLCIVPTPHQSQQAKSNVAKREAAEGDNRVLYPPDIYNPIIEKCVKEVKRKLGKRATQAEVMRRATAVFLDLRLKVPRQTVFENRVRKIFKAN